MIILSGHGSGAVGDLLLSDDFPTKTSLKISDLRRMLKNVTSRLSEEGGKRKIDIVGMDACAMSMAEVGYELKDVASYMVAAEGFELNTGWPYHRILEELINNSAELDPEHMATTIVKRYISYYSDYDVAGVSADLAACDLSRGDDLASAVKELASALKTGLSDPDLKDQIILAHWRAQSYKFEEYTDLCDFCNLLQSRCNDKRDIDKRVKQACLRVAGEIEDKYVLKSCYCGGAFQHSHGLSIYFPWVEEKGVMDDYKTLNFVKATGWGDFLETYLRETRREPRDGGKGISYPSLL